MKYFTRSFGILVAFATAISVYQPAQSATFRPVAAPIFLSDSNVVQVHGRHCRIIRRHRSRCRSSRSRRNRRVGAGIALGVLGGAIVGGAIARDRARRREVRRGFSRRHINWCYRRYRSYQERSNSWVSNSGRVRQCRSPYY